MAVSGIITTEVGTDVAGSTVTIEVSAIAGLLVTLTVTVCSPTSSPVYTPSGVIEPPVAVKVTGSSGISSLFWSNTSTINVTDSPLVIVAVSGIMITEVGTDVPPSTTVKSTLPWTLP